VAQYGKEAMGICKPFNYPLRVKMWAYFPLPVKVSKKRLAKAVAGEDWHVTKPDADNILKAASDALNGIVWQDDKLIAHAEIIKLYDLEPRLVIRVEALENESTLDGSLISRETS
jgi:Holliday junction resolvase RusA-like endonuclease